VVYIVVSDDAKVGGGCGTVEERLAVAEGASGNAVMLDGIRDAVTSLGSADRVRGANGSTVCRDRSAVCRIDQRFAAIDQRFASIDQRFVEIDQRFTNLDAKISRQFLWMLGVQMTMFVTMVGTVLTAFLMRP
jgi:hypothetical protein